MHDARICTTRGTAEGKEAEPGLRHLKLRTGPGLDNCRTISPVIVDVIVQNYSTITRQLPRTILKRTITQVQLLGID